MGGADDVVDVAEADEDVACVEQQPAQELLALDTERMAIAAPRAGLEELELGDEVLQLQRRRGGVRRRRGEDLLKRAQLVVVVRGVAGVPHTAVRPDGDVVRQVLVRVDVASPFADLVDDDRRRRRRVAAAGQLRRRRVQASEFSSQFLRQYCRDVNDMFICNRLAQATVKSSSN